MRQTDGMRYGGVEEGQTDRLGMCRLFASHRGNAYHGAYEEKDVLGEMRPPLDMSALVEVPLLCAGRGVPPYASIGLCCGQ